MKFFCEYCRCRIDTNTDKKCPNCGASYQNNAAFVKLEKEENERLNQINEIQNQVFNHVTRAFKFSKFAFIIPILIFIVVLLIIISSFIGIQSNRNSSSNTSITINQIY